MARRLHRRCAENVVRVERQARMKFLSLLIVLLLASAASANRYTFRGTWHTTAHRQLVGTQTAVIERVSLEEWRGHFYGTWHGADFSYTVTFSGPPDACEEPRWSTARHTSGPGRSAAKNSAENFMADTPGVLR